MTRWIIPLHKMARKTLSPESRAGPKELDCPPLVSGEPSAPEASADPELWLQPRFHGYHPGQYLDASIFGLDGTRLGEERFCVDFSPGGGFAGQVLRAQPLNGVIWGAAGVDAGRSVALKILRPRSAVKTAFRDWLFRLCYQASYAARLEESALRAGLIWQQILRQAVQVELGDRLSVACPLGYFWDSSMGSYVEVHQWIASRASAYQVGAAFFLPDHALQSDKNLTEMEQKRHIMARLVDLCHRIGAHGLARQYEWYTLVSQANVLTLEDSPAGAPKFAVVDCRPGLAVPFFLPLSPAHFRIILKGLRAGLLVHFDRCDLAQLDAWLADHPHVAEGLGPLADRLRIDDESYRAGLPDLWQRRLGFWSDRSVRTKVRIGRLQVWRRLGLLSPRSAKRLKTSEGLFLAALLLDNLPLLGPRLLGWLGSSVHRRHLSALVRDPSYRKRAIYAGRCVDLEDWLTVGRIPIERIHHLVASSTNYLVEKFTLGWLPAGFHRLLVDPPQRRRFIQERLLLPFDLCFRASKRGKWLCDVVEKQRLKGLVSKEKAVELCAQAGEPRLQGFVRDLGFSLGLELFSKLVYLSLAIYGFSSGDFLLLGLALLGPVPPSGVARGLYSLARLCWRLPGIIRQGDRRELASLCLGLAVAPWRFIGNLFAPLEMLFYYRRLSLLLADHFISQMVRGIPVFGGEGKLLEYWAFQATFNLPLSLYRRIFLKDGKSELAGEA
jgi:hypothetical protein